MESTDRWAPAPGFPGYVVSITGEVWSMWRKNGRHPAILTTERRRRLSPGIAGSNGYEQVWLYRDGHRHGRFVHTLVLEAFRGPAPDGLEARHLNGNERDNRLDNLTWGTPLENAADRERHGRTVRGERVASAVLTRTEVAEIRQAHQHGESKRSIARRFPVSRRQVGRILDGAVWA